MKTGWLLAGLGCALAWTGCGRNGAEAPRTATAARGAIRMTVPFQGELEARRVEMVAAGVQCPFAACSGEHAAGCAGCGAGSEQCPISACSSVHVDWLGGTCCGVAGAGEGSAQ